MLWCNSKTHSHETLNCSFAAGVITAEANLVEVSQESRAPLKCRLGLNWDIVLLHLELSFTILDKFHLVVIVDARDWLTPEGHTKDISLAEVAIANFCPVIVRELDWVRIFRTFVIRSFNTVFRRLWPGFDFGSLISVTCCVKELSCMQWKVHTREVFDEVNQCFNH